MAALVLLYVVVHVVLRMALTPTAGSDDVEQVTLAQDLLWDYGTNQAPLYPWIVWLVTQVLGVNLGALGLVRYGLVGLLHGFMYLGARRVIVDPRLQIAVAWSPLLFYPLGWRLHEADARGVLAAALVAAMLWLILRLLERRRLGDYAALGLVIGLGVLGMDWFVLALAALLGGLLSQREGRAVLRHGGILATLAVGLVVALPRLATLPYAQVALAALPTWPASLGLGLLALVLSVFPFWTIVGPLFPQAWRTLGQSLPPTPRPDRGGSVLGAMTCLVPVLVLIPVVLFDWSDALTFRIYPAMLALPLWLFWRVERLGWRLGQLRWLAIAITLAAIAAAIARVLQLDTGILVCKACRMQMPYALFADGIRDQGFAGRGTIIANDAYVAGNLRLAFPQARVTTPVLPSTQQPAAPAADGACLIAWHGLAGEAMPDRLVTRLGELGIDPATLPPPKVTTGILRGSGTPWSPTVRHVGLASILVPGGTGACR